MTPPAPITGSAIIAAIVSGPSRSIMSFSDCASRATNSCLALALCAETVVMRAVGVQHAVDRQVEAIVVAGKPGQRGGHRR